MYLFRAIKENRVYNGDKSRVLETRNYRKKQWYCRIAGVLLKIFPPDCSLLCKIPISKRSIHLGWGGFWKKKKQLREKNVHFPSFPDIYFNVFRDQSFTFRSITIYIFQSCLLHFLNPENNITALHYEKIKLEYFIWREMMPVVYNYSSWNRVTFVKIFITCYMLKSIFKLNNTTHPPRVCGSIMIISKA